MLEPSTSTIQEQGLSTSPSQIDFSQVQVCRNPVFVIGSFRSGTSALASSLGQHSAFWYSSETNFVCALFSRLDLDDVYRRGDYWLHKQGVTREEFFEYVGLGINALFTSRSMGKRWI